MAIIGAIFGILTILNILILNLGKEDSIRFGTLIDYLELYRGKYEYYRIVNNKKSKETLCGIPVKDIMIIGRVNGKYEIVTYNEEIIYGEQSILHEYCGN